MIRKVLVPGLLAVVLCLFSVVPASAAGPQRVFVVNMTRFQPVAQDVVVPAGQTQRFDVPADGFGRVSLLVMGSSSTGPVAAAGVSIVTVYGPPFVPSGPPRPLHVDGDGTIRDRLMEPVLGPAMAVVVRNDTPSDVTITLSAYFAN